MNETFKITISCGPNSAYAKSPAAVRSSLNYALIVANWNFAPIRIARDYQQGEVIEERRKPRMRDRFNPLYYIRKELQRMTTTFTQATDRIEQKIADVNANVEALKNNVATEAAQFTAVVEELRGMSTNENLTAAQSARLGALADQLDASATNIKAAADGVKGIVPDTPVVKEPPVDVDPGPVAKLQLLLMPQPAPVTAGTAFDVKVMAVDEKSLLVPGYAGTLHFSSSPANTGDVLPADHVYGTDDHPAVLLAEPGTYVLSVIDAGNPNIAPGSLTVTVN